MKKILAIVAVLLSMTLTCGATTTPQVKTDTLNKTQKQAVETAVNDHKEFVSAGSLTLAISTDLHMINRTDTGEINFRSSSRAITNLSQCAYASQITGIDGIALLGDILDGGRVDSPTKIQALSRLKNAFKGMDTTAPIFALHGNHDDNSDYRSSTEYVISPKDWTRTAVKPYAEGAVYDSKNADSPYYYKDFSKQKIRVIFLAFCDNPWVVENGNVKYSAGSRSSTGWGFSSRQCQWLAKEALNFSEKSDAKDWATLVLSHSSANSANASSFKNGDIVMKILDSYNLKGTYSGSSTKPDWEVNINTNFTKDVTSGLLGFVQGHIHSEFTIPAGGSIGNAKWQKNPYSYAITSLSPGFRSVNGFSRIMSVDRNNGYLFFTTMSDKASFNNTNNKHMAVKF